MSHLGLNFFHESYQLFWKKGGKDEIAYDIQGLKMREMLPSNLKGNRLILLIHFFHSTVEKLGG